MHSFTDTAGRPWQIALTIGDIQRVKGSSCAVDLLQPALARDGRPIEPDQARAVANLSIALQTDILFFYDVLQVLLEPDAEAAGVDPREFGRGLAGKALFEAHAAFLQEWRDFFVDLGRPAEAAVIQTTGQIVQAAYKLAEDATQTFDMEVVIREIAHKLESLNQTTTDRTSPATTGGPSTAGPAS